MPGGTRGTVHLNQVSKSGVKGADSTLRTQCQQSRISFLIDSGASHSVVPLSFASKMGFTETNQTPSLLAANKSSIRTVGTWTSKLHLPGLPPRTWTFLVADVSAPILGADLLKDWDLVIRFHGPSLSLASPTQGVIHSVSRNPAPSATTDSSRLDDLLKRFKGLFAE